MLGFLSMTSLSSFQCKNHSAGSGGLKLEVVRLKEELSQEASKRQRAEGSLQAAITDKGEVTHSGFLLTELDGLYYAL